MTKVLEILTCGDITLVPFETPIDFDYLVDLAQKYKWNRCTREQMYGLIREYGRYFWKGYYKGRLYGVVYICYNPRLDVWTIDGYRDDALCKEMGCRAQATYKPSELVIRHIFENTDIERIYGITDSANRALLRIGRKLGFKFCRELNTMFGKYTMVVKEREE